MATNTARIVLHEAKSTFLFWVIPLFVIVSCVLVAGNFWLPLMAGPPAEPGVGYWVLAGLTLLASLAIPVGAGLMFFFIPTIVTTLDPQRRVVALEFRRPAGRSVKEYPLAGIADIQPIYVRQRRYALVLVLKSGENIRLDYRLLPEEKQWRPQVERIKAQLAPFWTPGAGGG